MLMPTKSTDETTRMETLRALDILDTAPEERFDRLTRLARRLFGVPIALVSLVDDNRQWFKSRSGLDVSETSRDISFCGHAILGDDVFQIADASKDKRFSDNPLVINEPHIRFYAGRPLAAANGSKLGTLCIIDRQPRTLSGQDKALLNDLAMMAEQELAALQLATIDGLTLISNRRGFEASAQKSLALCRRLRKPASLLYIDMDGFKQINDRFGHAEGDGALLEFARLLKKSFRDSDVLGRLGGDEFAVLLTNVNCSRLASELARLRGIVDEHNQLMAREYNLRYSVGAVEFDVTRHRDIGALMGEADGLMYQQKRRRTTSHLDASQFGGCERVARRPAKWDSEDNDIEPLTPRNVVPMQRDVKDWPPFPHAEVMN